MAFKLVNTYKNRYPHAVVYNFKKSMTTHLCILFTSLIMEVEHLRKEV